jgi:hypothetical protein
MNTNIRTVGGSIGTAVTTSIVTSNLRADGLPCASDYTTGFKFLLIAGVAATAAALLIPSNRGARSTSVAAD